MSSLSYSKSFKQRGAMGDLYVRKAEYKARPKRQRSLVKKVNRLVRAAKSIEVKFLDTVVNFFVDATAEVQPAVAGSLVVIPQDDTSSGREGRKVTVKSLELKMQSTLIQTATAISAVAYVYLVQDAQANGAIPAVTGDAGIFTATFAGFPGILTKQLANEGRFRILRKYVFEHNVGASTTAANQSHILYKTDYIKLNLPIDYDAAIATGALASLRSNNIFLVAGSDGTSDDVITMNISSRIRYTD